MLLHCKIVCTSIGGAKTHAQLLFIDFSSAFNTILPSLLAERLICHFKLDSNLIGSIVDFLSDRSQCVRVGALSNWLYSLAGAPQGCCLSPFFASCTLMSGIATQRID